MEDKKLTPQESMDLITSMIQSTKQRVVIHDLRVSVMWAILAIATAVVTWFLLETTHNPWFSLIWLAIPIIGIPANIFLERKIRRSSKAKTHIDKVSGGLWSIVGYIAIGLTIICFIAQLYGYPQAWLAMLYYAFIIVGFGAVVTGLLLHENAYIFGGLFSIFSGFAVIICNMCGIILYYSWIVPPLYILCFLLMFIVPALIISRKIKEEKE